MPNVSNPGNNTVVLTGLVCVGALVQARTSVRKALLFCEDWGNEVKSLLISDICQLVILLEDQNAPALLFCLEKNMDFPGCFSNLLAIA